MRASGRHGLVRRAGGSSEPGGGRGAKPGGEQDSAPPRTPPLRAGAGDGTGKGTPCPRGRPGQTERRGDSRLPGTRLATCLVRDSAGAGLGRPGVTGTSAMVLHGEAGSLLSPAQGRGSA